eukprot:s228_g2.t1
MPLAAREACATIPTLRSALEAMRRALTAYGFVMNFSKGKTSAVLTLRGANSTELRKQYQLHSQPGITCSFDDGTQEWLHFVPAYRHFGPLFTSKHDLGCELSSRVGMAKSAFSQLAIRLLTNKHLPSAVRLHLFKSLVATKMFFGRWPGVMDHAIAQTDARTSVCTGVIRSQSFVGWPFAHSPTEFWLWRTLEVYVHDWLWNGCFMHSFSSGRALHFCII